MIKIIVTKKENGYQKLLFKGHALYDDYGKDIVCAGVSSILVTTVNAIFRYDKAAIDVKQNKDVLVTILKTDKFINLLLDNMLDLLSDLVKTYPKNVSIREDGKDE